MSGDAHFLQAGPCLCPGETWYDFGCGTWTRRQGSNKYFLGICQHKSPSPRPSFARLIGQP